MEDSQKTKEELIIELEELRKRMAELEKTEKGIKTKREELEEINRVTMDREERILELKEEVNSLLEEIGRKRKYYS
ncbi:MAG: hypothetical protein ACE5JK_04470 [Candidatus Omnitrophota bacterium]